MHSHLSATSGSVCNWDQNGIHIFKSQVQNSWLPHLLSNNHLKIGLPLSFRRHLSSSPMDRSVSSVHECFTLQQTLVVSRLGQDQSSD